MQPYFMPYIGYFQLISLSDQFVIYDDVNFINKGWINRNYLSVNGAPWLFSIPLQGASQNKKINEIYLLEKDKWVKNFLKTIELNYKKKAPFYSSIYPWLENLLHTNPVTLDGFLCHSLKATGDLLGIKTKIIPSSSVFNNHDLKGEIRIIDICKQLKATMYVNPPGGEALYNASHFEELGMQLRILKCKTTPKSGQMYCILHDLLMNGSEAMKVELNNYELLPKTEH
jgi:hypothetical protein